MKKTLATFISLFVCLTHTTGFCFAKFADASYSPPILETRNWQLETVSLSADPIGLAGGENLYAYGEGNPMTYIDPLGLCAQTESSFWENLVTGAVAGDFADDTGWGGLLGQVGVGLIPGVGQVADIRDIAANGKDFWNEPSWGAAAGVVGSAIGFVPLFGDLAKGAIKGGKAAAKEVGHAALKNADTAAKAMGNVTKASARDLKGISEHALKKDILGKNSPDISKFNISKNSITGEIILTPVQKGGVSIETGITLDEALKRFPK